ncbi:class I SAM-dependent methyltransferase [Tolypothrix sp. PCC 7910]|uniref:SAM-dependent methyltransferase n=1 Tax=Tolypothrix sp. PCC 7910 TaxID=2099387 RepID=UPI0014278267|nr:methyltransferase domain-containing protein [Tolypothrix sp. PCC 7910]QIR40320.1 class I SAM-dependent methyltransferase [Tolypothrix sp. PCC 7910]
MNLRKILLVIVVGVSLTSWGFTGAATQKLDLNKTLKQSSLTAQAETLTPTVTPQTKPQERPGDVPYVATPQPVVDAMLKVTKVGKNDMLYDLGSGDGRIVITAAKNYGTRGVGIDISPDRIKEANENAQKVGVSDRVRFIQQDLFNTDLSEATVVTLYLLPEVNLKLRTKLFQQLKPGTRIVSHAFDMGDWKPQQTLKVNGKTIYYWVIPENLPANLR